MGNWRPLNWEDDKFHRCMELTEGGGSYRDIYEVFEAGAEAMLEALKEKGVKGYGNVVDGVAPAGWLVFIEGDE